MITLPVIRWGKPYTSLDTQVVSHFLTGEPVATIGQVGPGLVQRDLRRAARARDVLREIACVELIARMKQAAELYRNGTLLIGDTEQTPADFVRVQSATTGLPENMCRANMEKNVFVLEHMDQMLDALTRGLDLSILTRGYGVEARGITVSYQAQTGAIGLVLPSNSPGVHTLWLPVLPMQIGLVLKPGAREPWTPYRMTAAFVEAGIPAEAISIYPSGDGVGAAVVGHCGRSMVFGGGPTVDQYKGDDRVQVHGPGFSKILFGDDCVDDWESHLDLMVESVLANGGRSCINASSIWASRHTEAIAEALADRIGPVEVRPPEDPEAALAAFVDAEVAAAIWKMIESDCRDDSVRHVTERFGERLEPQGLGATLRPTVLHCDDSEVAAAGREFMFPFASVVRCPQAKMVEAIGPTLVATLISEDEPLRRKLIDATQLDRLNLGPIPTTQVDWLQPHEGNLFEFLFRSRALQVASDG